jgi:predicted metal-dependent HD superfamily phosphohydrolase
MAIDYRLLRESVEVRCIHPLFTGETWLNPCPMYFQLEAWRDCVASIGVAKSYRAEAIATFQVLDRAYRQPWRVYHDRRHIAACLALCHELRSSLHHPAAVEFAIWLHDAVYVPQRADNEARSARWAAALLQRWQVRAEWRSWIVGAILATQHRCEPATDQPGFSRHDRDTRPRHPHPVNHDRALLLDIDLSILAAPAPAFSQYEAAIRAEYGFLSDAAFRVGRLAVLRSFLDRDCLFQSAIGFDRFEVPARQNLTAAIDRLNRLNHLNSQ